MTTHRHAHYVTVRSRSNGAGETCLLALAPAPQFREDQHCPGPDGKHFWSHPDSTGMVECLWCRKRQLSSGRTAPTQNRPDGVNLKKEK